MKWMRGYGHQVGLELSDVDVERAIEAEGRSQGRDDLRDEAVQVGVGRALDVEVAAADVVESLVVEHERRRRCAQGASGSRARSCTARRRQSRPGATGRW
jgi:hypothetical protein